MGNQSAQNIDPLKILYILFIIFEVIIGTIFATDVLNLISSLRNSTDPVSLFWLGFFYLAAIVAMVFFLYYTGDKIRSILIR